MTPELEHQRIVQYLLNQLSPAEQEEIEDRYIADAEYFEHICAVEDDLIEDYLAGALPTLERQRFQQVYFGSPERRKRLELAQNLRETLKLERTANAFATAAQRERRPSQSAAQKGIVLLSLVAGVARADDREPQTLVIGPETHEIVLDLDVNFPDQFDSYTATLKTGDGEAICSQDGLAGTVADARVRVRWQLSADVLQVGEYLVSLQGIASGTAELIDHYYFRVES